MKLVFCPKCQDVFKLHPGPDRSCACGHSTGGLFDDLNGWYKGGIPLGMANRSLTEAITEQTKSGLGPDFKAFVIPEKCDTLDNRNDEDDMSAINSIKEQINGIKERERQIIHEHMARFFAKTIDMYETKDSDEAEGEE